MQNQATAQQPSPNKGVENPENHRSGNFIDLLVWVFLFGFYFKTTKEDKLRERFIIRMFGNECEMISVFCYSVLCEYCDDCI